MIPVLHLRQGTGLYGADRAVLALAAATPAPTDALGEETRRRGLRAARFESAVRFDLACARAVARAARAEGVQLLHAHDFKSLFIAVAAGAMARVPAVATYHGDTASTWQVRGYEAFSRALGNLTRGVAGVSRSLEEQLKRWVRLAPVAASFSKRRAACPRRFSSPATARCAQSWSSRPVERRTRAFSDTWRMRATFSPPPT